MIPIDRLSMNTAYWFECTNYSAFGMYKGSEANMIELYQVFIYLKPMDGAHVVEEFFYIDMNDLVNIKINRNDKRENFLEYYKNAFKSNKN